LLDVLERKLSTRIVEAPTPAAATSDTMAAAS
jgi:hypothetical protein